ncbi:STY0301 family protein [Pseudomonas sp. CGJS7]|uniref:STY0301 family protein n=1 Tax=Pseudomonas sp. CGJS7 TaxID=3109348 RepID=UPI003FA77973
MTIYATVLASALQILGCPTIVEGNQSITPPPAEWSVRFSTTKHKLREVDVYSGPPDEMRLLIGSDAKSGATEWSLAPRETWVDCKYSHSAAVLRRNLGIVRRCIFTPTPQLSAAPATFTCTK